MMQFSSDRPFKVWDYNVSHKQLLIRSPSTPEVAGNVDLVFWQVEFVAIPTVFDGIELCAAVDADRVAVERVIGGVLSSNIFCLRTRKQRHLVAAGGFKILSNELDIFDSTLVYFGVDRAAEWYGKVLAHS